MKIRKVLLLKFITISSIVLGTLLAFVAHAGNPQQSSLRTCWARDYRSPSRPASERAQGAVALDAGDRLWKPGQVVNIVFLDGSASLRNEVATIAKEWTQHADLKFDFDNADIRDSDIAITFTGNGNNSFIGSQSQYLARDGKPSMHLGSTGEYGATATKGTILHEFGHALGLHHEHKSPAVSFPWNLDAVYHYYRVNQGWTDDEIKLNLLERATTSNYSEYDANSIMHYQLPDELFTDHVARGRRTNSLSTQDKKFIAKLYPTSNITANMVGIYRSPENYIYEISRDSNGLRMVEKEPDGSRTISEGRATQRGRILVVQYISLVSDERGSATLELLSDNQTLKGRYYRRDENKTFPMSIRK